MATDYTDNKFYSRIIQKGNSQNNDDRYFGMEKINILRNNPCNQWLVFSLLNCNL
jgi:hypothetical protein